MSATPDETPAIQPTTATNPASAAMLAVDYLARVARACPAYGGPVPTARTGANKLTLFKLVIIYLTNQANPLR